MAFNQAAYGSLVYKVAIDDAGTTTTLQRLKNDIRSMGNEWKSTATSMASAGDAQGALQAKMAGLKDQIEAQAFYNEKLEKALNGVTDAEKLSSLEYSKYNSKLNQGRASLARFQAQLEKNEAIEARVSTGIKELIENNKAYTDSLASEEQALRAEGKETEANAKHKQLLAEKSKALKSELELEKKVYDNLSTSGHSNATVLSEQSSRVNKLRADYAKANEAQRRYATGLDEMHRISKNQAMVSSSLVGRLREENKTYTAQGVELKSVMSARRAMIAQYQAESKELTYIKGKYGVTSNAYAKQAKVVNDLGGNITKTTTRMKTLNSSVGSTSPRMQGFADKMANMSRRTQGTSKALLGISKASGYMSAGIAIGVTKGVKLLTDLNTSFTTTKNLIIKGGEESAREMNTNLAKMRKNAASYSKEYGVSQQKIADGYQDLIKRGYSSAQAVGSMKTMVQGAIASGDDFNDVTKVAAQALESFGLRTKSATGMARNTKTVVNQMAYAADMTATDFQSLGKGMEYVGNAAHQAGFTLSETSSAMGILSNSGLEADKAGTGLRKTINSLISPTKGATVALKDIGLSTKDFIDKNGKMKSMTEIFGLLNHHMSNLTSKKRNDVFHAVFGTTGQAAGGILEQNYKALGHLNSEVEKSSKKNYVGGLSARNMQTAQAQFNKFKTAVQALGITMANTFLPTITKVTSWLTKMIDKFDSLSAGSKKVTAALVLAPPIIMAISGAIGGIMKVAGPVSGFLLKIIGRTKLQTQDATTLAIENIQRQTAAIEQMTLAWREAGTAAQMEGNATSNLGGGTTATSGKGLGTGGGSLTEQTIAKKNATKKVISGKTANGNITPIAGEIRATTTAVEKSSKSVGRWGRTVSKMKGIAKVGLSGLGDVFARAGNVVSIAITAWDLGGSILKVFKKPSTKNKIEAGSKATGTLIGGSIGAVFGGPAGAMVGSALGDMIGGSAVMKKAASAGAKVAKSFADGAKKNAHGTYSSNDNSVLGTAPKSSKTTKYQAKESRVSSNPYATSVSEFQKGAHTGNQKMEDEMNRVIKSAQNNINRVPKAAKEAMKKVSKSFDASNITFGKLEFAVDNKALDKARKDGKAGYKSIIDTVQTYAKNQQKGSKSTMASWVKQGLMSKQDAKTALSNEKSYYDGRTKAAKKSVNALSSIDKAYYKQSHAENKNHANQIKTINQDSSDKIKSIESKKNNALNKLTQGYYVKYKGQYLSGQSGIAKINKIYGNKIKKAESSRNSAIAREDKRHNNVMTSNQTAAWGKRQKALAKAQAKTDLVLISGSDKQKSILKKLASSTGKLSNEQADKLVHSAYKTYKGVVKHADKTYKDTKSAAAKKYKATVAQAQKEYYQNHSISKKQMEKVTSNAESQYKQTVKSAKSQRDETAKHAKSQYTAVTKKAKKQMKDHDASVDTETGHVKKKWNGLSGSLSNIWDGIVRFWKNFLASIGIGKGSSNKDSSKSSSSSTAKSKLGNSSAKGRSLEANAIGRKAGRSTRALVGEAGPELAYEPWSGKARILGENGPEIAHIGASENVLTAEQTRKVMHSQFGKGSVLPGYSIGSAISGIGSTLGNVGGTIASLTKKAVDGAADLSEKVMDKVSDFVSSPVKWAEKKLLNLINWPKTGFEWTQNFADEAVDATKEKVKEFVKSLASKLEPATESGSYDGAKGHYNPALIEKAAKAMHAWPLPAGFSKALQATIMSESGGRSVIQSIHDSNSGGNEAGGILQYTPPTFAAFAMPGHRNRMNPYDELLAFFNNSDWKNSIGWTTIWGQRKIDWLHSGPQGHRRFESGGLVDKHQLIEVAEKNKPEMVVALSNKDAAIRQLKQSINYLESGSTGVNRGTNVSDNSGELAEIASNLKTVTSLLQSILTAQATPNVAYVSSESVVNAVASAKSAKDRYQKLIQ